ncbi:glycosyltransferase [Jiella sonneratiae]|uniref:Uncharacterized protein n=1 Tax=Jiella sonneratiae TaxID=2816856 RepID=A0ABS3JAJ4_9HYPH|nr:hypothetical protein [Jiella sonneratiae]MBO0906160.1 hypothetical protein [Jiella sonneratiae]
MGIRNRKKPGVKTQLSCKIETLPKPKSQTLSSRQRYFTDDDPATWADHVSRLLEDDALWTKLSTNGRDFVAEHFSVQRGQELMRKAFHGSAPVWGQIVR